jgi:hypothetical protein
MNERAPEETAEAVEIISLSQTINHRHLLAQMMFPVPWLKFYGFAAL